MHCMKKTLEEPVQMELHETYRGVFKTYGLTNRFNQFTFCFDQLNQT